MTDLDDILAQLRWAPRYGWHDDHRAHDGTPAYLPAMQQVRAELEEFLHICQAEGIGSGPALQLGMGECDASHEVWRARFSRVVTIDWRVIAVNETFLPGQDTAGEEAWDIAKFYGPYDLLFIDADHTYEGVRRDHLTYAEMVRPGGIVAFHDALPRAAYPEVEVHRYVATLPGIRTIGDEVGIAWLVI